MSAKKKKYDIGVVGLGVQGQAIVLDLDNDSIRNKNSLVRKVYIWNKKAKKQTGMVCTALRLTADQDKSNTNIQSMGTLEEIVEKSDILIFAVGYQSYDLKEDWDEREDGFDNIYEFIKGDYSKAYKTAGKHPLTIVVSNPTDAVSYAIWKQCKIPSRKIVGLNNIDQLRLERILRLKCSQFLRKKKLDIKTYTVGPHSSGVVPVLSKTKINGLPYAEFKDKVGNLSQLRRQLGAEGPRLTTLLNNSTYAGVVRSVSNLLYCINAEDAYTCVSVYGVVGSHPETHGLFIGYPVCFKALEAVGCIGQPSSFLDKEEEAMFDSEYKNIETFLISKHLFPIRGPNIDYFSSFSLLNDYFMRKYSRKYSSLPVVENKRFFTCANVISKIQKENEKFSDPIFDSSYLLRRGFFL